VTLQVVASFRVLIYDHNISITYAPRVIYYASRNIYSTGMDWHAPSIREGREIPLSGLEIRVDSPTDFILKTGT
jgi:hypothetical protein